MTLHYTTITADLSPHQRPLPSSPVFPFPEAFTPLQPPPAVAPRAATLDPFAVAPRRRRRSALPATDATPPRDCTLMPPQLCLAGDCCYSSVGHPHGCNNPAGYLSTDGPSSSPTAPSPESPSPHSDHPRGCNEHSDNPTTASTSVTSPDSPLVHRPPPRTLSPFPSNHNEPSLLSYLL